MSAYDFQTLATRMSPMIFRHLLDENDPERLRPALSREPPTIEEVLRDVFANHEWQMEQATAIEDRHSEDRSMRLLRTNLSATQRNQYENFGYFEVIGCTSAKRYRIHHGYSM